MSRTFPAPIIGQSAASGAQVIDGSLKFDGNKSTALKRTPSSDGNRKTWTWSAWVKKDRDSRSSLFSAGATSSDTGFAVLEIETDEQLRYAGWNTLWKKSTQVFRDYSQFYHIVLAFDSTQGTASNRVRMYKNGTEITDLATNNSISQNTDYPINDNVIHYIGGIDGGGGENLTFNDFTMTQVYLIDGQQLGPDSFGFTDPLTNTWRPKKYEGTFGTNGFWLPFDGNSPIGEDKSGNGNDWTPVNFGGSNSLDKATGALPILNTVSGGNYATVGVRTDAFSSNLKLAVDHAGSAIDRTNAINGNTNLMTSFTATNTTYAYPTDASGAPYNSALYFNGTSDRTDLNFTAGDFNFMHNQDDSGTVEFWFYNGAFNTEGVLFANTAGSPDIGIGINASGSTGVIAFLGRGVSGSTKNTPVANLPQNKWSHICLTKQKVGSNVELKLYVNGVLGGENTSITATDLSNSNSTYNYFRTGCPIGHEGSRGWTNAYMSDLRIYNTVKYTSDFIVASTSPDILPDTPSGVTGGSKLTKITDGAVSFDGSGDFLETTSASCWSDSGNCTFECFIYPTTYGVQRGIFHTGNQGDFCLLTSGKLRVHPAASNFKDTDGIVPLNVWSHIALVQSATNQRKVFINGVDQTFSSSGSPDSTNWHNPDGGAFIGDDGVYRDFFIGFMSNVRVIKGTALYTSNFTPPSAPLTDVTYTKLLCCQSNEKAYIASVAPGTSLNDGTVWSSNGGGNLNASSSWVNVFNGVVPANNSSYSDVAAAEGGNTSTITFSPAISGTIRVRISSSASSGSTLGSISLSDSSSVSADVYPNSATWKSFGSKSNITSLTINAGSNGGCRLSAIEVDGFVLIDGYNGKSVTVNDDAAASTFNPFNTDIHTVRGQETGYPTFNPLDSGHSGASITFSDGNLKAAFPSNSGTGQAPATIYVSSGKWYCEYYLESVSDLTSVQYGIVSPGSKRASYIGKSDTTDQYGWEPEIDRAYNNGNNTTPTGKTFTSQWSVAAMALDLDNGTWEMFIDGIPTGTIYSGINGTYTFAVGDTMSSGYHTHTANFGQKPFKFSPPDGFQPLSAANIRPETVIARPDQFVDVSTWIVPSGNADTTIVTPFKPDLVIAKNRSGSDGGSIYNTVSGDTKFLRIFDSSNASNAEATAATRFNFNDNGFTFEADNDNANYGAGDNSVAWSWKAGGNKNTFNVDDVGYSSASDVNMSVGSLTSSGYNTSDTWTSYLSSPNGTYGGSLADVFDGSLSNGFEAGNPSSGHSTIRFEPTTPITVNSRIRIYVFDYNDSNVTYQFRVNDGSFSNMPGESSSPYRAWRDLGFVGSLTSFEYRSDTSITYKPSIFAIEIDGKMLVNSGTDLSSLTQYPSITNIGASVGTKQGFSIIKTNIPSSNIASSFAHGLNQAPDFALVKPTGTSFQWDVYHKSIGEGAYLVLNSNAAQVTGASTVWNNNPPTSSVFHLGDAWPTYVGTDQPIIAYLWHDVPGLQKFGKYTGNGDSDGTFIELGFRPAIVLIKVTTIINDWVIYDTQRDTYNPSSTELYPNLSNGENSSGPIDILSNGFKHRSTHNHLNKDGETYAYAAWAETPSSNLYGGQSNAR